jgi:anti-sigma regulatory factor (Ser/Thr protein kinase)
LGGVAERVRFLDMAVAGRNPNRIIPWVLRAFADEHADRRVRVIGEPIWPGRPAAEVSLGVQHEALINSAFEGRTATVLCPYDAVRLDPAILGYAARTHPVIDQQGTRRRSTTYTGPDEVVAALNQPLPEPTARATELIFDVSGLRGVRLLVDEFARKAGLTEQRVNDLQVAVNEIATNTLVHGGRPGTLRIWQDPDRILCDVHGPGEITDCLAGRIRPAENSVSGRGLLVADRLCDLVQTYSGPTGTTTRLHVLLAG